MRQVHAAAFAVSLAFAVTAAGADTKAPAPPPPAAAQAAPPSASPAPAGDPSKAEGHYKNIQVLKGIPWEELVPAMQFITSSLNVDCEFCHVDRAPEKDDKKEKQMARKMIAMTFAINRDNFDGHREVTCVSCHRGATHPVTVPPVVTGPTPPDEPAKAAAGERPAATAVLDKYLAAVGGAEAISKVTSHAQKGTLSGFAPEPVPVDVASKAGGKRITTVHGQRGDNITAVNGGQGGWLGNPGRPPRDMSATESEAAFLDAALLFPTDLKTLFKEFEVRAVEPIDGKDSVLVVAKNPGKPPVKIWFDAGSGLAVRLLRVQETPLGRNPTQIDYADYRDAGGVKIPFRWTVSRPSGQFSIQLAESRQDVAIPDSAFEKTAPAPATTPAPPS